MCDSTSKLSSQVEVHRRQFDRELVALTPALRSFACRFYQTLDDREDLVQETLLKALRYREHFEPGTKLKSWLFTIMRNHFCSQFVNRKREPNMEESHLEALLTSLPNQEWALSQNEVAEAIERMPDIFRVALLQVSAGIAYEDAARSAGCEVGTIKSRVHRARRQLEQQFGELFPKTTHNHL